MQIKNGTFWNGDCLELMKLIPDNSIDMILCDLPYGTTACSWDTIIPFEPLWKQYLRICKPNAAIVLTASQPFTTALIMSNIKHFKYCWVWSKNIPTGFANAKTRPMKTHEDIGVFYRNQPVYNKQFTVSKITDRKLGGSNGKRAKGKENNIYGNLKVKEDEIILKNDVCPRSVLEINCVSRANGTLHPTQKPVALFEYLIKTYTHEGMTVLDNCAGSGTTAIACENTNRKWICIEKDLTYYLAAIARVWKHDYNSPQ